MARKGKARKGKAARKTAVRRRRQARLAPVPPGSRTVTPYLVINGAAQALEWYTRALGAKELSRSPMPDGRLMHASMKVGDTIVMMSDEFPGSQTRAPTSVGTTTVTLHIYSKDVDRLWQQALAAGARVAMPLENQFWGERYGQIDDPFGHRWSMSMRIPMSPVEMEAKRQAAMSAFSQGQHPGYDQPRM